MKVHYYFLASAFCVWIHPAFGQFFYSIVQPQLPATQSSYIQSIPQPVVYNQFYNNPFQIPQPSNIPIPVQRQSVQSSPQSIPEFHGFGYKTDFQDGATSTVFYVTGADQLNLRNFPNLAKQIQPSSARGRSLSLESNSIESSAQLRSNGLLQPAEFDKLFDQAGLFNFYTFPASTAPLIRASNISDSSNSTEATTTTQENEPAESIINAKIVINDLENRIKTRLSANETAVNSNSTENIQINVNDANTTTTTTTAVSNDDAEATTLETTTQA